MLKILLSNDDGVHAPGIRVLAEHVEDFGQVTVVAPDRDRSGASNSLSLTRPLRVKHLDEHRMSVEGTPTDCVHLAITGLLSKRPDMVLSGINAGSNLGDDVWYSGTVAAAMEGRFLGLPAIAFSLASDHCQYFETAGVVAKQMVQHLLEAPLPPSTILNVNIPDVPLNQLCGYDITRLGTRHCAEPTIKQMDPRGHQIYWVGPAGAEEDAGPGTDFFAIREHKVSITPLQIDITHYGAFEELSQWVSDIGELE